MEEGGPVIEIEKERKKRRFWNFASIFSVACLGLGALFLLVFYSQTP